MNKKNPFRMPVFLKFPTEEEEEAIEKFFDEPNVVKGTEQYICPLIKKHGQEWADYWVEKRTNELAFQHMSGRKK